MNAAATPIHPSSQPSIPSIPVPHPTADPTSSDPCTYDGGVQPQPVPLGAVSQETGLPIIAPVAAPNRPTFPHARRSTATARSLALIVARIGSSRRLGARSDSYAASAGSSRSHKRVRCSPVGIGDDAATHEQLQVTWLRSGSFVAKVRRLPSIMSFVCPSLGPCRLSCPSSSRQTGPVQGTGSPDPCCVAYGVFSIVVVVASRLPQENPVM
jgi:hypothetical protein